jgi:TolB protein
MRIYNASIIILIFILSIVISLTSCQKSEKNDDCNGDCPLELWIIDFEPAWSPDGKTIAYAHNDTLSDSTGIYLVDTSGSNKRILFAGNSPTWSPDNKWIAFSYNAQIYKIRITGDSLTQLTTEGRNFFPSWSPDGQWIVYDRSDQPKGYGVWIMKNDSSENHSIGGGALPAWHPDGKIVIASVGISSISIETKFVLLYPFEAKTADTMSVVKGNENYYPQFSPDGTKIIFQSQPDGGEINVWIMNADGSNKNQLTNSGGYSPAWSTDGKRSIYTNSAKNNGRLWIMNADGSNKKQFTF